MGDLLKSIKRTAKNLGFDLVGVTNPREPAHLNEYKDWLKAGFHASMGYLANERAVVARADPRVLLPDCRSILSLGTRYPPQFSSQNSGFSPSQGRIASYAWGEDYHLFLPERLKAIVHFIETEVGEPVSNRWYTDTGPILERELAQEAGLGWIGKNTCLINPQHGSYFFLAEILLGLDLQPDPPFTADHCGSCTRCIDACPTKCILPNRVLDASRCISYLTIEKKGAIPPEIRPEIGNWVFGCDICQEVCPWNMRFAQPTEDPVFNEFFSLVLPSICKIPWGWTHNPSTGNTAGILSSGPNGVVFCEMPLSRQGIPGI